MRWFAGVRQVDVLPNGVDSDFYHPQTVEELPSSAVFWGRLDFEPNIQGLQWFCLKVWPQLHDNVPDARFTIIGFQPGAEIDALRRLPGIDVKANLSDLRGEVSRHSVVVLPFVSGGGIKNKLLEAAAMGKPIVCSPLAVKGLRFPAEGGFIQARTPQEWIEAILGLWSNHGRRHRSGTAAREWVSARHTWVATATDALGGVTNSLQERGHPA